MKKILFIILSFGFTTLSCDNQDKDSDAIQVNPKNTVTVVDNTISTDFNANKFTSNVEAELLKEIHICDAKASDESNLNRPACSPKLFRFFKLSNETPLKDGFILLTKAGVGGMPLRRVLIFQREQGILVKVNGFVGNLIERRKSTTAYDDLVLRFADRVNNDHLAYYNCLFTWKNGKYEYINCEIIDEGEPRRIKAEFKDSMAVEIKKIIDKNGMIF